MGHKNALLLDRLDRDESHRGALHGFTDRLSIERIAFAALDISLLRKTAE
jgi:hypothetical protein